MVSAAVGSISTRLLLGTVALVRAGASFVDGVKVEREDRRSAA